jgi:hypothetical protein
MLQLLRQSRVIVTLAVGLAVLVVGLGCLLQRRTVVVKGPSYTLGLDLPPVNHLLTGSKSRLFVKRGEVKEPIADVLYQFFENPALLVPGKPGSNLGFLLYQYDIRWEIIAFDPSTPSSTRPDSFPLDKIILRTSVAVGAATPAEVAWVKEWLAHVSASELRRASVPTCDIGYVRTYGSRENLLAGIAEMERFRDAQEPGRAPRS